MAFPEIARVEICKARTQRRLPVFDGLAPAGVRGASLFGGRASLIRSMMGALLIAVLNNGMALLNVNADAQYFAKGLIILAAVVLERAAALARA